MATFTEEERQILKAGGKLTGRQTRARQTGQTQRQLGTGAFAPDFIPQTQAAADIATAQGAPPSPLAQALEGSNIPFSGGVANRNFLPPAANIGPDITPLESRIIQAQALGNQVSPGMLEAALNERNAISQERGVPTLPPSTGQGTAVAGATVSADQFGQTGRSDRRGRVTITSSRTGGSDAGGPFGFGVDPLGLPRIFPGPGLGDIITGGATRSQEREDTGAASRSGGVDIANQPFGQTGAVLNQAAELGRINQLAASRDPAQLQDAIDRAQAILEDPNSTPAEVQNALEIQGIAQGNLNNLTASQELDTRNQPFDFSGVTQVIGEATRDLFRGAPDLTNTNEFIKVFGKLADILETEAVTAETAKQLKGRAADRIKGEAAVTKQRIQEDLLRKGIIDSGLQAGIERQVSQQVAQDIANQERQIEIDRALANRERELLATQIGSALTGQVAQSQLGGFSAENQARAAAAGINVQATQQQIADAQRVFGNESVIQSILLGDNQFAPDVLGLFFGEQSRQDFQREFEAMLETQDREFVFGFWNMILQVLVPWLMPGRGGPIG